VIYDFIVRAIGSGDSTKEPFYFGTDTSFGLKVAWSGMTSAIPDTVKLGYNRKEFALAPIHVRPNKDETVKCVAVATVPSFVATIHNKGTTMVKWNELKSSHRQVFATGEAATKFAELQRKALQERLTPIIEDEE
jgi:hypothetical protein